MFARKILLISAAAVALALAACVPGTQTAPNTSVPATSTVPAGVTQPATVSPTTVPATASPPATATAAPSATTPPTAAPSATVEPTSSVPAGYIDNRSDAVAVLTSYFNAINRREYARAYGYWEDPTQAGDFAAFQAGYANTTMVQLATGPVNGDAGAGNLFYTVPATLRSTLSDGTAQTFVGCYTLHLSQPGVQGSPPFRPLAIRSADVQTVANDADTAALMAAACPPGAGAITPQPTPVADDVSAGFYLDDRSGPVEVLRSLYNAINRQEYLRAYGYWDENTAVGPFADFEQGYQTTESVELKTGEPTSDPGAGQIFYTVPVTLKSHLTDGTVQIFAGCYILHLSNPGIQAEPPFQPVGIRSATLQPVADEAAATAVMAQPCAP